MSGNTSHSSEIKLKNVTVTFTFEVLKDLN